MNFPIYRISSHNKIEDNSTTSTSSSSNQGFSSYNPSLSNNNPNLITNNNMSNSMPNINNPNNNINSNNNINPHINSLLSGSDINDGTLKKILIDELKFNIEPKIREESKKLKQHEEKLNNYKNEFKHNNDKIINFLEKREELVDKINKSIVNLDDDIRKSQEYNETNKKNKSFDFNSTTNDFLHISNPSLLNVIACEASIEDFISALKRSINREPENINGLIKNIRVLTRELYKVKYVKDKLINNVVKK